MDFQLTSLFVVPSGNTLPTTGSTENLTDGQVGLFINDARTIATAGNVGAAEYLQIAQGRPSLKLGSKISEKIVASKVHDFYKIAGNAGVEAEVWTISDFNVPVTDDFTLTLRAHSYFIDALFANGFTRSYTIPAGCLDCGGDPCATADPEAIVDALIAKYNEDAKRTEAANIPAFFTFAKTGSGDSAALVITGKLLTKEGKTCDLGNDIFDYDRMSFRPFASLNGDTASDPEVTDCPTPATITLTTRSSYAHGTSDEVAQLELDYETYQSPIKNLFRDMGYNPYFESHVAAGETYNFYYMTYSEYNPNGSYVTHVKEEQASFIAVVAGSAEETALVAVLTAFAGAPVDKTYGQVVDPVFP